MVAPMVGGAVAGPLGALTISVSGSWSPFAAQLAGGAGTDFAAVESSESQVTVTISDTAASWGLYVYRSDPWPGAAPLEIRLRWKAGDVWEWTNWTAVTTEAHANLLFSGAGNASYSCQLRVHPTVTLGDGSFETTVTYRVDETSP